MLLPSLVPVSAAPSHRHRRCARHGGFTLVELMVTVAVASVIVALGAPSFLRALARHAILAQAEELQDAMRIGRNEAMKRSGPVVLCRTESAHPGHCTDSGGNWQTWLLFADLGRSGAFAAGDPILRQHVDVSSRMTVTGPAPAVRFESTGIAHADTGPAVFLLAPAGSASDSPRTDVALQRQVCVSARGEVAIVGGDAACP
ncbi:MAG: GspH/FimT family pseudopilin [Caulobacter sp.]|nr:GspH/FimT family pseudopilin [Vitreoscilla sp.]